MVPYSPLDASSALLGWPLAMLSINPEEYILTRDYRIAISAMSATVAGAMKATPPAHLPSLRAEKMRLDSKLLAIRCVEHAAGEEHVQVDSMLANAASPADVFRSLCLEGSWVAAEKVRRSEFAQSITPEHMASAVVGLPATIDPRSYCSWLEKAIIPGLSINHPILAAIRYWACRVADAFDDDGGDDNELGLDSAITLLKVRYALDIVEHGCTLCALSNQSFFVFLTMSFSFHLPSCDLDCRRCHRKSCYVDAYVVFIGILCWK